MPKGDVSLLGWIAIAIGAFIIIGTFAFAGGNIFGLAFGLFFFVIGALARRPLPTKTCPFCRSQIDPEATVCPKCTRDMAPPKREPVALAPPPAPARIATEGPGPSCPRCGAPRVNGPNCPSCGLSYAKVNH
jgi:predicted amidophosphoribosyltransferase